MTGTFNVAETIRLTRTAGAGRLDWTIQCERDSADSHGAVWVYDLSARLYVKRLAPLAVDALFGGETTFSTGAPPFPANRPVGQTQPFPARDLAPEFAYQGGYSGAEGYENPNNYTEDAGGQVSLGIALPTTAAAEQAPPGSCRFDTLLPNDWAVGDTRTWQMLVRLDSGTRLTCCFHRARFRLS